MPIRVSKFEMPKQVVKDEKVSTSTFGRYVAEPFEIGYARTIGNSLRRVLLSSIEGVAISAVKIEGAPHEFMSLPGVVEDVTDIILALKKVILRSPSGAKQLAPVRVKRHGPCVVTAGDLADEGNVEVLNPDLPIATLGPDGELDMEVRLSSGRGFCPAEWDGGRQQEIGVIPVDRIYSPVTRVNFQIGHTRLGQRTDYESLTLEITTDGRVSADNALTTAAAILRHQLDVFADLDAPVVFEDAVPDNTTETEELARKLNMSVNEIELSVRAANCLNSANINTVGELVLKTEAEMLKYRNFGKKSLNEIKDKLKELGIYLGMPESTVLPLLKTPPSKSEPPSEEESDDEKEADDEKSAAEESK
jgi:DNA-directed RNA polymerase subunit alpha